mmetsp:Transcript_44833/g.173985  ORF Transcript_44833/g.173985 Transcript_44833/m.173985 type:complete len:281 (+) Transcript_44833:719-1561(+)
MNFIVLARCARSFPLTATSQPCHCYHQRTIRFIQFPYSVVQGRTWQVLCSCLYLCTSFHHEADNTVARATNREASDKLIFEGLGLGNRAKATVIDLVHVQHNRIIGKVEPLLDQRRQLVNPPGPLSEHVLRACCQNPNFLPSRSFRSCSHIEPSVPILRQLPHEKLIHLRVKHAVHNETALLRYLVHHVGFLSLFLLPNSLSSLKLKKTAPHTPNNALQTKLHKNPAPSKARKKRRRNKRTRNWQHYNRIKRTKLHSSSLRKKPAQTHVQASLSSSSLDP